MGEKTKQSTKAPLFGGRELLFSQRELLLLVGPLLVEQLLEVTVGMADTEKGQRKLRPAHPAQRTAGRGCGAVLLCAGPAHAPALLWVH